MKLDGHHDKSVQAAGRLFIHWLQAAAAFTLLEMIIDTKRAKKWCWKEMRQTESFFSSDL